MGRVGRDGLVPHNSLEEFAEGARIRSMQNELHVARQLARQSVDESSEKRQKANLKEHILDEQQQTSQTESLALQEELKAGRREEHALRSAKEALTMEALSMAKERGAMAREREMLQREAKLYRDRQGKDHGAKSVYLGTNYAKGLERIDSAVATAEEAVKGDAKEVDGVDEGLMMAIDEVQVAGEEMMERGERVKRVEAKAEAYQAQQALWRL